MLRVHWLGRVAYRDHRDRPKVVDYWLMEVEAGAFAPNDEVDALVWVGVDRLGDALSYEVDRQLVARVGDLTSP